MGMKCEDQIMEKRCTGEIMMDFRRVRIITITSDHRAPLLALLHLDIFREVGRGSASHRHFPRFDQ